ncbi:MAG: hypothetical protein IIA01_02910 [Proteobacteria bacterium]|nr:hypothetical protein [Pseudomonadota bacterium]
MANAYGNLGVVYKTRGEIDRAEEMWVKSLGLFNEVGAARRIEQVERWLTALRAPKK